MFVKQDNHTDDDPLSPLTTSVRLGDSSTGKSKVSKLLILFQVQILLHLSSLILGLF